MREIERKEYTAAELLNFNPTDKILKSKAKELSKNFYHYTTSDSLKGILTKDENGNRFLHISNLSVMNDRLEEELHHNNSEKVHSLCFSCTSHEKIPLWYLYSGICGNGARLGFTPGKMLKLLNSINYVYAVDADKKVDYSNVLDKSNGDFEFMCGWVYYIIEGYKRVVYRNDMYNVVGLDQEILKNNYFVKSYPWEYESEFRIVIKNNTSKTFSKVAIVIPEEIIPSLEVMSAPEQSFSDELKKAFLSSGIVPEKIKESKLRIEMNLLKNNRKAIVEYIDKWFEEDSSTAICKYISSQNKCDKENINKEKK